MEYEFSIGQPVCSPLGNRCIIRSIDEKGDYDVIDIGTNLFGKFKKYMLLPVDQIVPNFFNERSVPNLLTVDNFYKDPFAVREIALAQSFEPNIKYFKGKRSTRILFPNVKERFEKLLGVRIKNWLQYGTNGCFQITKYNDPLVYHSDSQEYAAAVYLSPNAPTSAGTSFWKDKKYGCRRFPNHPLEASRFETEEERTIAASEIYTEYNITHPDNWELVDKIGSVFNRLAIWNAQLVHSASCYDSFVTENEDDIENCRLVQLFFFDIE